MVIVVILLTIIIFSVMFQLVGRLVERIEILENAIKELDKKDF